MKKILCLGFLLLCSACASQEPPPPPCPWAGIDTNNPNFYQQFNAPAMDVYYGCELQKLSMPQRSWFNRLSQSDIQFTAQNLQYQQNLWRKIALGELSPGNAQEQWIEFASEQHFRQQQVNAAQRQTEALEDAAQRQRDREYRERDREHRQRRERDRVANDPHVQAIEKIKAWEKAQPPLTHTKIISPPVK